MLARNFVLLSLLFVGYPTSTLAANRAEILAYTDGKPSVTLGGVSFTPPLSSCERDNDPLSCSGTTPTRIDHKGIAGLRHPAGTSGWGIAAFGKFVLLGNYEQAHSGTAINGPPLSTEMDQGIGVFDTEREEYCFLDLDPSRSIQGTVQWLVTASPWSRQSRIYFQGFAATNDPGYHDPNAAVLGYIDGDLDNPTPCDPISGWQVQRFTPSDLLASAAHLPASSAPCLMEPTGLNDFCGFDGLQLLHHDPVSQSDVLILNNWWSQRIVAARVSASNLQILDSYPTTEPWQPGGSGHPCLSLRPVVQPAVDPTRTEADLRFAVGYDQFCDLAPAPSCAAWEPLCPASGSSCVVGSSCPSSACTFSFEPCTTNADCGTFEGTCSGACQLVHPGRRCSGSGAVCARNENCPPNEDCICGSGRPVQEFSLEADTISPTSARFQTGTGRQNTTINLFDQTGGLWIADHPYHDTADPTELDPVQLAVYERSGSEHSYFSTSTPAGNQLHPPGELLEFERTRWFDRPASALQIDDWVYTVGRNSVQRARFAQNTWERDSSFRVFIGADVLPGSSLRCDGGSNAGQLCQFPTDCPDSTCVNPHAFVSIRETWKTSLAAGGTPPSLWTAARHLDKSRTVDLNAWIVRIPVPIAIPDSATTTRPTMLWTSDPTCQQNCDRMWLVSERNGTLHYRLRDDGVWGSWHPLPTNRSMAGGASLVFTQGDLEIVGRTTSGALAISTLTSPLSCVPGTCSWSPWALIPGSPVVAFEPAVATQTFGASPGLVVAATRASDKRVTYTKRTASGWQPWRLAGNKVEPQGSPALVNNPNDQSGRLWLMAVRPADGQLYWARITDGLTFGTWNTAKDRPTAVASWGASPSAVNDGGRIRVFVPGPAPEFRVWQLTHDGVNWDDWGLAPSRGESDVQPATTVVLDNTELLTTKIGFKMESQMAR